MNEQPKAARVTNPDVIERLKGARFAISDYEKDLCECMHRTKHFSGTCEICGEPVPTFPPLPGYANIKSMINYYKKTESKEFSDDELKDLALCQLKLTKFMAKYCSLNGYVNTANIMPIGYAGQMMPLPQMTLPGQFGGPFYGPNTMMGPATPAPLSTQACNNQPHGKIDPMEAHQAWKSDPMRPPYMNQPCGIFGEPLKKFDTSKLVFRFTDSEDEEELKDFFCDDYDKFVIIFTGFDDEYIANVLNRRMPEGFVFTNASIVEDNITEVIITRKDPDEEEVPNKETLPGTSTVIEFHNGDNTDKLNGCTADTITVHFIEVPIRMARNIINAAPLKAYKRRYKEIGSDVYVTLIRR